MTSKINNKKPTLHQFGEGKKAAKRKKQKNKRKLIPDFKHHFQNLPLPNPEQSLLQQNINKKIFKNKSKMDFHMYIQWSDVKIKI